MIPKVIHYCWFGGKPKPELAQRCIRTWQKYCKGYIIREWNEDNFDVSSNPYTKEAYEAKRWAFITDYVRLWAMYNYGGVYMDTDVEVIRPLDKFLKKEVAFSGFENDTNIPTGIMAAEKGCPIIKKLLDEYDDKHFVLSDGSYNMQTNVETITNYMLERGFVPNNTYQCIEGFAFYPKDYFCPKDYITGEVKKTRNTHTIHHFDSSWHTEQEREHREQLRKEARKEQWQQKWQTVVRRVLGEEGYGRWEERFSRYQSWEEFSKLPRRIVRKMMGKSNLEE